MFFCDSYQILWLGPPTVYAPNNFVPITKQFGQSILVKFT